MHSNISLLLIALVWSQRCLRAKRATWLTFDRRQRWHELYAQWRRAWVRTTETFYSCRICWIRASGGGSIEPIFSRTYLISWCSHEHRLLTTSTASFARKWRDRALSIWLDLQRVVFSSPQLLMNWIRLIHGRDTQIHIESRVHCLLLISLANAIAVAGRG